MNRDYYRMKIREFLYSRKVKDPNIRLRALERVFDYMTKASGFIKNDEIILLLERKRTLEILSKVKGGDLSSSDKHVVKLMYDYYKAPVQFTGINEIEDDKNEIISQKSDSKTITTKECEIKDIEKGLINGTFLTVNELENGKKIPDIPGIYCIKIRKGIYFSEEYGKIREDGIIYIGKAEKSLRKRLWEEELNHERAATFFRSIGAMLGYRPPKGSLYEKDSRNYTFDFKDTEAIKKWMRQSLLVNFIVLHVDKIKEVEDKLIKKYSPLVNLKGNPQKSRALEVVRKECVEIAQSKPGI